jgi:hypothetical protein
MGVEIFGVFGRWQGVLVVGIVLSGCVSQGSGQDEQVATQQAKVTANAGGPESAEVLLRETADGYEIEIVTPEGFVDGAFQPVLFVGEKEFRKATASLRYRDHGLVFPISSAEFAELGEGEAIRIQYGPSARGSRTFGAFARSAVLK